MPHTHKGLAQSREHVAVTDSYRHGLTRMYHFAVIQFHVQVQGRKFALTDYRAVAWNVIDDLDSAINHSNP
jgi:hypothetical protein